MSDDADTVLGEIVRRLTEADRLDEMLADLEAIMPDAENLSLRQISRYVLTHDAEAKRLKDLLLCRVGRPH